MRKALLTCAVLLVAASVVQARGYMKLDGIDGESLYPEGRGWIDILSMKTAITRPGEGLTGQTRRRGAVVFGDIVCTKELDKSSPLIMASLVQGGVIQSAVIELTIPTGAGEELPYLRYELKNVLVSSYSVSGDGEAPPREEISLNFEEIKVTYTKYDQEGQVVSKTEFAWNVATGQVPTGQ